MPRTARPHPHRRQFRAALGAQGLSQKQWAAANRVHPSLVSRVLNGWVGAGSSRRVRTLISAFAKTFGRRVA